MKKLVISLIGIFIITSVISQNNSGTIIGGTTPDPSAELEIKSNDRGFLPPRITTEARNTIQPKSGMLIFNSDKNTLEYYNGQTWVSYAKKSLIEAHPDAKAIYSVRKVNSDYQGSAFRLYRENKFGGRVSGDVVEKGVDNYGRPKLAFSLRRLFASSTKAIRVVRDDKKSMDIGFDDDGNLDEKQLLDFLNECETCGGDLIVRTWYNQMEGEANLLSKSNEKGPKIVSGFKINRTSHGAPSIIFTTEEDGLHYRSPGSTAADLIDSPGISAIAMVETYASANQTTDKSPLMVLGKEGYAKKYRTQVGFLMASNKIRLNADNKNESYSNVSILRKPIVATMIVANLGPMKVNVGGKKYNLGSSVRLTNTAHLNSTQGFTVGQFSSKTQSIQLRRSYFRGMISELIYYNNSTNQNMVNYYTNEMKEYWTTSKADVQFNEDGYLDSDSISDFCKGVESNCQVIKWYDQSGDDNHAFINNYDIAPYLIYDKDYEMHMVSFGGSKAQKLHLGDNYIFSSVDGQLMSVVAKPDSNTFEKPFLYDFGNHNNNDYGMVVSADKVGTALPGIYESSETLVNDVSVITQSFEFDQNGKNKIWVNGTLAHEGQTVLGGVNDRNIVQASEFQNESGPFTIGAQSSLINSESAYYKGSIMEMIIYDNNSGLSTDGLKYNVERNQKMYFRIK